MESGRCSSPARTQHRLADQHHHQVWRVAVVHHQQEHNNALLTNIIIRTEVSPARCLSVKTAGGGKVVNARMEEPGGGWRRRIPDKFFQFSHNLLAKFPCALWVGSQDWLCTSFQPRRGGELYLRK